MSGDLWEALYRAQVAEHQKTHEKLRISEKNCDFLRGELLEHQRKRQATLDWIREAIGKLSEAIK